jgi:4-hydroxy-tetrahydrodipicolinate synthase
MTVTLEGLVPVLATPFDSDGEVDYASLDRLARFAVRSGASGAAVFGLASEAFALRDSERREILRHVTAIADDAVPVIAGVNATALQPALEQAKLAADGGASALMVLPPFMVKPTPNQLVDFYGALAARSGVPVMVQDAPSTTGVAMPVPLIAELTKLDGVVAVKVETQPTPPKVGAIVDAVDPGCAVFGGQNALFCLEEYDRGAVGTMPACEFTDLLADVLATWKRGDRHAARAGFNRLLPLIRFGLQPGLAWAVHKQVLVRRGIISTNTVRSPGHSLDPATARALEAILDDLQMPAFGGDLE